jgi:integrase
MSQHDQISVTIVKYPDRKYLMMRYVDPTTGKQIARSTRTTRRREAERTAVKWEAEVRAGRGSSRITISWEAFRDRYEDEVIPGLAVNTGNLLTTTFNAIERILMPKRLSDLTADRLSHFQAKLREGGLAEPSIRTYLAHLVSSLKWAATVGLIPTVPKVQRPKRVKKSKMMKGRPITGEEFDRLLAKTIDVVGIERAESWKYLLRGLWLSGLRISEAVQLYWDRDDRLRAELGTRRPMLIIPGELEKGHKDRLLPMAPEFAQFLIATPEANRKGRIFRPLQRYGKDREYTGKAVARVISKIGQSTGIKVHQNVRTGKIKYASAHDLRRSFGERWARKVMPQVLQELMRHESIETTLKYYVGRNAELTADVLWDVFDGDQEAMVPSTPDASDAGDETTDGRSSH